MEWNNSLVTVRTQIPTWHVASKLRRYTCDAHIGTWIPVSASWEWLVARISTASASISICLRRTFVKSFQQACIHKTLANCCNQQFDWGGATRDGFYLSALRFSGKALGFFCSNLTCNNQSKVAWTVGRVYLLIWRVAVNLHLCKSFKNKASYTGPLAEILPSCQFQEIPKLTFLF